MKYESDNWTSLHVVNSFFCQPVKGFEEEKQGEQSHKLGREVILEDGEGKTSLSDRIPTPFHKMLKLCCSQLAKEQLPHQLAS